VISAFFSCLFPLVCLYIFGYIYCGLWKWFTWFLTYIPLLKLWTSQHYADTECAERYQQSWPGYSTSTTLILIFCINKKCLPKKVMCVWMISI
jgi:hypothetical protein